MGWTGPAGGAAADGRRALQFRLALIAGVQALAITGLSSLVPAYLTKAGAGDFLVGLSFTAWAITRGGFGLVAGRAYGRFGERRLLTAALLLFALATLGYALSRSPEALVALRLVQGVAAGLYWTALLAATAAAAPPAQRLSALMRVNVAAAAAGLLSNALAGALASAWSPRAFFWLECVLLLGAAVPLAATLPVDRDAGGVGVAQREAAASREGVPPGPRAARRASWRIALAAVGNLAIVVPAVGAPVLLLRAGGGYGLVGGVGSTIVLANIAAQSLAPRLAARLGTARLLAVAAGVAALALGALAALHGALAVAALCVLISAAVSLAALTWLSWAQAGVPASGIGRVTGLFRGVCDLSTVLAYTGFGLIAAHLIPGLLLLAALVLAAGVGALCLGGVERAA